MFLYFSLASMFSGGVPVALPTLAAGAAIAVGGALDFLLRSSFRARRAHAGAVVPAPRDGWRGASEAAFVACGAMALTAYVAGIRPPRQAEVEAHFSQHQRDYELLREAIRADALVRVGEGGRSFDYEEASTPAISEDRAATYRRLLQAIGAESASAQPTGEIVFPFAAWGSANRGWRMSVVWSREKPSGLLPSIDDFRKRGGPLDWDTAYGQLGKKDWYVALIW